MSLPRWTLPLFCLLVCLLAWPLSAAEVVVSPGTGTLAAAIAAASDGDVLRLQEGAFLGNVTVNKSLTIRPIAPQAVAYIGPGSYSFTVAGAGIHVTLQSLTFDTTVIVNQAAEVNILENRFLGGVSLEVTGYQTSEGDGTLAVIGNRFDGGSIGNVRSDDAYIAGNTVVSISADRGGIWVVGNKFSMGGSGAVVALTGSYGEARVIGNQISGSASRNYGLYGRLDAIWAGNPVALISGNTLILSALSNTAGVYGGIRASQYALVQNNVIYASTGQFTSGVTMRAIESGNGKVVGNIIYGYDGIAIPVNTKLTVENNLCFAITTANTCGSAADGNLTADPKFIDLVDFELAQGSPAIDAGPADPWFADLDRTRNDIGVHGGPWAIDQYDAQRSPDYSGPYVYPLFKANSSLSGGVMHIRALGVARLR